MPIRRLDRPSLPGGSCAHAAPPPPMSFGSFMLDSPSLDRPFGIRQTLVQALRTAPAARPRRATRLMGDGKGVAVGVLGGPWRLLGGSSGHPGPPRGDADEAPEVLS